ncbi:MAG: VOC family protein [Actinobacteria bacterium]|nr:VOC family protein [Actinomycetota bacterium]
MTVKTGEVTSLKVVLDCADPEELSAFWAPALGYAVLGSVENYTLLAPPDGAGPQLLLQKVPEGKSAKNRMHLDLDVEDIEVEAQRLETLGAARLDATVHSEHGSSWLLMADPEGNEFCVCDSGAGGPDGST